VIDIRRVGILHVELTEIDPQRLCEGRWRGCLSQRSDRFLRQRSDKDERR